MTTADYALIVSLASMAVAFGSLIWNVWQKFIFVKPNIQVAFGVWKVMQPAEIRRQVVPPRPWVSLTPG